MLILAQVRLHYRHFFSIFFNMKGVFSLESTHLGDFNKYTQYTTRLSQICSNGTFSKRLKNRFKTAMVNEPSGFEPLKFYCICYIRHVYDICNCLTSP